MIALLLPHTGAHVAPHAPLLAALPPVFRRALRMPWRKPAVPAELPPAAELRAAGTAVPSSLLGDPVLGDRMISDVRAEYDGLTDLEIGALRTSRARAHADLMHAGYARAVDRLRADAGLPTVEEMHAEYFGLPKRRTEQGKPPWYTTEQPVYGQAPQLAIEAAGQAEAMLP